jgi:hypothetical protein
MSKIGEQVISDIRKQEEKGLSTYGTTMDREDYELVNWLQEAYEECLDKCLYLKAAINKIKNGTQGRTDSKKADSGNVEQVRTSGEVDDFRASL